MKRAARGLTRIGAFGEELPNIENRIELASDKDEFGMPLGEDRPQLRPGRAGAVERQFRGGPQGRQGDRRQEVWSARGNMPTIHLMGGTIMGTDAGNSVTNSYGQTHELPNLPPPPGRGGGGGGGGFSLHLLFSFSAIRYPLFGIIL